MRSPFLWWLKQRREAAIILGAIAALTLAVGFMTWVSANGGLLAVVQVWNG